MDYIAIGGRPTVFISHAACDKKAANLLTEWVAGVGGGAIDVFCTSAPGSDIPAGAGFFQYIKDVLRRSKLVIHFISPAFLRSEFCMLELGAAWAQDKSFPLLAPPLTINDMRDSALASLQLIPFELGDGLDRLRDRISDLFQLPVHAAGWSDRRDRIVRSILEALGKPAAPLIYRMASVGVRGDHLEVWAMNAEGRVTHSWWPNDDGARFWNKPYDFDAPGGIVDIAAASRGPDHGEVFALDNRGVLWHRWWGPGGWSGWMAFGGQRVAPPLSACSFIDGHVEVFALDPATNVVIHQWSEEAGQWESWIPLDKGLEPG
jgi:hypothetical protein